MEQRKVIIYYNQINKIGGIETWIYNLCANLYKFYDITVLYESADANQLGRLNKIVNTEKYSSAKTYTCDVLLDSYQWKEKNLKIKCNKNIAIIHCDYAYFKDTWNLGISKHADEFICVSQSVKDSLMANFDLGGRPVRVINNILSPLPPKKLRIASATRLTPEKGYKRMLELCRLFKENDIPFEWKVFTSSPIKTPYKELECLPATLDVMDELYKFDYLAQLSDSEGYCYSVLEALQNKVPVLVTDIPAFKGLIHNGYNGYLLPLDMSGVDVSRIYNNIPCDFDFDDCIKENQSQWMETLGKPVLIEKEVRVLLKVTKAYYDMELNKNMKPGDIINTSESRASVLIAHGACQKTERRM